MKKENNQFKCHSRKSLSGMKVKEVIMNLIQDLQRSLWSLRNCVRGRFQITFGMTPLLNSSAFTLIELLIVVLIIAILATIALPQYQKAVFKSRMTEMVTTMHHAANMFELYYLEHGTYTVYWSSTDISLPDCTIDGNYLGDIICKFHRMDLGTNAIEAWDQTEDTGTGRLKSKANISFTYYFRYSTPRYPASPTYAGKFRCRKANGSSLGGSFCKQLCGSSDCTLSL